MSAEIQFTKIKNDVNGNPRYVTHFLNIDPIGAYAGIGLSERYNISVKIANKIGGRKFHNKQFGGGIVFQSYCLDELVGAINQVAGKSYTGFSVE